MPHADALSVVVHPTTVASAHVPTVAAAIRQRTGLAVACPADEAGVAATLAAACTPILVTYRWRDSYLQPGLRWVQGQGVGYEQYPLDQFRERGVVLTNASGIQSTVIAEHVFALLLGLTRGINHSVRRATEHRWDGRTDFEIGGMTLGILGLGSIGEAIARRAAGWDLTVIGVKNNPATYRGCVSEVLAPDRLIEVCERADILVSCLPGGRQTHRMLSTQAFAALGAGWFVNVGRGSVVDEPALITALTEGALRGAGLDVFETEPLPTTSPLWDLPNVIITPHKAGQTPRYPDRLAALVATNVEALRGRGPWANRVI